jgi:hypothetical protein
MISDSLWVGGWCANSTVDSSWRANSTLESSCATFEKPPCERFTHVDTCADLRGRSSWVFDQICLLRAGNRICLRCS